MVSCPCVNCNTSFLWVCCAEPLCHPDGGHPSVTAVNSGAICKVSSALNISVLLPCPGEELRPFSRSWKDGAGKWLYSCSHHMHPLTVRWRRNRLLDLACSQLSLIFQAEMVFDPNVIISLCMVVVGPFHCRLYCTYWGANPNLI